MRREILTPQTTGTGQNPNVTTMKEPVSVSPELVEKIHLDGRDDGAIQALFTPERLAIIDAADDDISAGNGLTFEQLSVRLAVPKSESACPSSEAPLDFDRAFLPLR